MRQEEQVEFLKESQEHFALLTDLEREYFSLMESGFSKKEIANKRGVCERTVCRSVEHSIRKIKNHLEKSNQVLFQQVPDGHNIVGVSTYSNGQWVKTKLDDDHQRQAFEEAVENTASNVKPYKFIKSNNTCKSERLNKFLITDMHIGMVACDLQTDTKWDADIAKDVILQTFGELVENAPPAKYALLTNLGDFFHIDGIKKATPKSGHPLDSETYHKCLVTGYEIMESMIAMLLTKYESVGYIGIMGNHDPASILALDQYLKARFMNNNNFNMLSNGKHFNMYRFWDVMLCQSHGDMRNFNKVAEAVPNKYPVAWGKTKYRYADVGHLHHEKREEIGGLIVEQHGTIIPSDYYSDSHAWISSRKLKCFTYEKNEGEVSVTIRRPRV